MAVATVLNNLHIPYKKIELGTVLLENELSDIDFNLVVQGLAGFELYVLKDRKEILVEKIKTSIIEIFRSEEFNIPSSFTNYLSKRLFYDYTHLSNIFSEAEGYTIEHYYIHCRLERVKELIANDDYSITEISNMLGFSSVSHLCIQFKKILGKTPSEFKKAARQSAVWRPLYYF